MHLLANYVMVCQKANGIHSKSKTVVAFFIKYLQLYLIHTIVQ